MPKRFRDIKQQFDRVSRGISAGTSRAITCASYVNGNMGFAVSKLYINQYFDKNARKEVSVITVDEKYLCFSLSNSRSK